MNNITFDFGVLSAMITPAVLILACGSLLITTSQRLSVVIERVRKVSKEFMQIQGSDDKASEAEVKRSILYRLLKISAKRSKLLTQAMTLLYLSLGLFISTSLAIGLVGVTHVRYTWIPTALGLMGALALCFSSAILIVESRLTFSAIVDEMDFVIKSIQSSAPKYAVKKKKLRWRNWFRL